MATLTVGTNKFVGKINLQKPRLGLGDNTYLQLTTDIERATPGSNIKLQGNGKTYWITDILRIADLFPDAVIAEHIRVKLNKTSTYSEITYEELAGIKCFGTRNEWTDDTNVLEWVEGELLLSRKTISSFEGIQYLTGMTAFIIKDVKLQGSALDIDLRFAENLIHMTDAFMNTSVKSIKFGKLNKIRQFRNTFNTCLNLNYIELPPKIPTLIYNDTDYYYLDATKLDVTGRTIKYNADSSVTSKTQIEFHNPATGVKTYKYATLNYSNLNV